MGWSKLDDGLDEHPKIPDAVKAGGLESIGVWALSLTMTARNRLAGRVPKLALQALLVRNGVPMRRVHGVTNRVTSALVKARLWVVDGDGWRFHDYAHWSGNRPDIHEKRVEAGRKGGQASGEARRSRSVAIASTSLEAPGSDSDSDSDSDPRSERPGPSPEGQANREASPPVLQAPPTSPPASATRAKRVRKTTGAHALPATWDPTSWVYDWSVKQPSVLLEPHEVDRQIDQLRDWAASSGAKKADWDATLRGWLRRTRERNPNLPEATPADLFARGKPPPAPPMRPEIARAAADIALRVANGEAMPDIDEITRRTAARLRMPANGGPK